MLLSESGARRSSGLIHSTRSGQLSYPQPGTIAASEPPRQGLAPRAEKDEAQRAPSLTSEAVPSTGSLVKALARFADGAIGGAQVFGTWTFRDPPARPGSPLYTSVGFGGAERAVCGYLRDLAEVYPGMSGFVAMEPHADRVAPHFHGLIGGLDPGVATAIDRGRRGDRPGSGDAPNGADGTAHAIGQGVGVDQARARFWQAWFDRYGMARLEEIHGDGASLYVSKYSLKGADLVPWYRIWEPGELRNEWARSSHSRRPHR